MLRNAELPGPGRLLADRPQHPPHPLDVMTARHVPFWRRRFDDAGVDPASRITSYNVCYTKLLRSRETELEELVFAGGHVWSDGFREAAAELLRQVERAAAGSD